MLSLIAIYNVVEAIIPLYVAMALAFISKKWFNLFSAEQCSGINTFVSNFSIPLMGFQAIYAENPYHMDLKLIISDVVQKFLALLILAVICKLWLKGNIDWLITGFYIITLPNTLIIGIPLLTSLYGGKATKEVSQIVMFQGLVWTILILFLFEYRAAQSFASTPTPTENADIESQQAHSMSENEVQNCLCMKHKLRIILYMVAIKIAKNPNTYGCLGGLIWSLISFRWGLRLPTIVENSISIIAKGGLGMSLFSLGLFTASKSKIISCGNKLMFLSLGLRFIIGPALMAIPAFAIRMKGYSLQIAIVQATLPQGIITFVFANEYGLHPDISSTGVIIGMIITVPVTVAYHALLDI